MSIAKKILDKLPKKEETKVDEKVAPSFFDAANALASLIKRWKSGDKNFAGVQKLFVEILDSLDEVDEQQALAKMDALAKFIRSKDIEG